MWLLLYLIGCASTPTYILSGQVVEVRAGEVVIDHGEIEGFMGPMTMPFRVEDASVLQGVEPGQLVIGRIAVDGADITLEKLRVTGTRPLAKPAEGPAPLGIGEALPDVTLTLHTGETLRLDRGPLLLSFVYTRCPDPTFCPATVARLNALQDDAGEVRLVALTLDPGHDTVEVLADWAVASGADGWVAARASEEDTRRLAMLAGLAVSRAAGGEIVHQLRWLAVDEAGRLVARHDTNAVSAEVLLEPLR